MLNWLASIGESIGVFVQFVTSTITGLLSVFILVGQSFGFLMVVVEVMPLFIHVFIIAGLGVVIFYHFIGR